jgi:hypothetical protein
LTPSQALVRTGGSTKLEHFGAYAITAAVCSLAFAPFWRVMSALLLYAAALEFLQRYAPGRNASVEDFFGSAVGVIFGMVAIAALVAHASAVAESCYFVSSAMMFRSFCSARLSRMRSSSYSDSL